MLKSDCRIEPDETQAVQERGLAGESGFPQPVVTGLSLLLQAHEYAHSLCRDPWDFAVDSEYLYDTRLTVNDLRWLAYCGYVEHAVEITSGDQREFREHGSQQFLRDSCFILTEKGVREAHRLVAANRDPLRAAAPSAVGGMTRSLTPERRSLPVWDPVRRELHLGGLLVKRFKLPSGNQERVLDAFSEEAWAVRIDDPLPPVADVDPKRRLHDTIKGLNRHQKNNCLRFAGDGRGEGVLWEAMRM